ncbi:MAG TPA: hypothetical protein VFP54_01460 [Acidimicrobiales bacterium]|nr:hypothetical protein [Acidimicrobiales bacterium]
MVTAAGTVKDNPWQALGAEADMVMAPVKVTDWDELAAMVVAGNEAVVTRLTLLAGQLALPPVTLPEVEGTARPVTDRDIFGYGLVTVTVMFSEDPGYRAPESEALEAPMTLAEAVAAVPEPVPDPPLK